MRGVGARAGYRLTDHTADVGLHTGGESAAQVFEQAELGMVSLMYDAASVTERERAAFDLEAADGELLLASWLNELLYVIEARRLIFVRFELLAAGPAAAAAVDCAPWRLRAAGLGESLDARRHAVRHIVKAATLHGLELRGTDARWEGRVLLDV